MKIILNEVSGLPVGNLHRRPRLVDEGCRFGIEPLEEAGECVGTSPGVGNGPAWTSAVHSKTIHRVVVNEIGAGFDGVPSKRPRKRISEGHQILVHRTIRIPAAVTEGP